MKHYFVNSSSAVPRLCVQGKKFPSLVNPTGEVLTVSELVHMMERGQDISAYTRMATWGSDADQDDHDQVDLHSFQNLDFSERSEFARSHAESVQTLAKQLDEVLTPKPSASESPGDSDDVPKRKRDVSKEERSDDDDVSVTSGTDESRESEGATPSKRRGSGNRRFPDND